MDVSIVEAKRGLSELIRAVAGGEKLVITRLGKPVAQITPALAEPRPVLWGGMRDRIKLLPGWDDPILERELVLGSAGQEA